MKPSSFQTTIENQFDYICKKAIDNERKDYMKSLSRQSKRETMFSDLGDYLVSQIAVNDIYPSEAHTFHLYGSSLGIESDLLSEALRSLPDKKREIILLYYFMDMSDTEIAELLHLNRSTICRQRTSGLALIKDFYGRKTKNENYISYDSLPYNRSRCRRRYRSYSADCEAL